jgi:hypothetical protein
MGDILTWQVSNESLVTDQFSERYPWPVVRPDQWIGSKTADTPTVWPRVSSEMLK